MEWGPLVRGSGVDDDVTPTRRNDGKYRQPALVSPWPIAKPIASRPVPLQHQHLQHLLAHCHHPYLVRPAQTHTQVFPLPGGFPWAHSSRGKPRRGMMRRAVFSDLQRKGLEKRFQLQKYISKPDRKKLAEKLGLKDSQVRRGRDTDTWLYIGITFLATQDGAERASGGARVRPGRPYSCSACDGAPLLVGSTEEIPLTVDCRTHKINGARDSGLGAGGAHFIRV
ncbi:unnamed protein product [Danaus chrysippus]|uniref:(African queen) hypothetical protein n=1 Tax=Danaus chrysippus TaxID=151541 RepID=A0A8J2R385_9NEOP|nr:unnamed protein product [Danaus chrysippus]